jgi:hypothetical protein
MEPYVASPLMDSLFQNDFSFLGEVVVICFMLIVIVFTAQKVWEANRNPPKILILAGIVLLAALLTALLI